MNRVEIEFFNEEGEGERYLLDILIKNKKEFKKKLNDCKFFKIDDLIMSSISDYCFKIEEEKITIYKRTDLEKAIKGFIYSKFESPLNIAINIKDSEANSIEYYEGYKNKEEEFGRKENAFFDFKNGNIKYKHTIASISDILKFSNIIYIDNNIADKYTITLSEIFSGETKIRQIGDKFSKVNTSFIDIFGENYYKMNIEYNEYNNMKIKITKNGKTETYYIYGTEQEFDKHIEIKPEEIHFYGNMISKINSEEIIGQNAHDIKKLLSEMKEIYDKLPQNQKTHKTEIFDKAIRNIELLVPEKTYEEDDSRMTNNSMFI